MLPSQRNAVLRLVREEGLDPRHFEWLDAFSDHTEALRVSVLFHQVTEAFFVFDFAKGKHYCTFSPGSEKHEDTAYPGTWSGQLSYCREWLRNLRRELEQPDLWAELWNARTAVATLPSQNDPGTYTAEQREAILEALSHFRRLISETYEPTKDQQNEINERLDYLTEALNRLNRFDWQSVALSTIIGIATTLTLDTERGRQLFGLFEHTLSYVLKALAH